MAILLEVNWTAVSSISTLAAALLAAIYVVFTYRLLKVQQDQSAPCVVVYTKLDSARPTIIVIVIENIGRSLARDVRFELPLKIPRMAWGLTEKSVNPAGQNWMNSGPLIDGIPALAPGQSRIILWGQYWGLRKALPTGPVMVKSRFKYGRREMKPVECVLEIESFGGDVDWTDTDGARKCAEHLEEIKKVLEKSLRKSQ